MDATTIQSSACVGKYIPRFGTSALSIVGMTDAALSRTSADHVAEVQARLAKCDQGNQGLNLDIHGQVTDRRTYKQRGKRAGAQVWGACGVYGTVPAGSEGLVVLTRCLGDCSAVCICPDALDRGRSVDAGGVGDRLLLRDAETVAPCASQPGA